MASIGTLQIDLRANSANLQHNLRKAATDMGSFERKARRTARAVQTSFRGVGRSMAGFARSVFNVQTAIGTLAGTAGLGLLIKQSVAAGSELDKLSKTFGVSVEELQNFRYAAQNVAGVVQKTADMGLQRFTRRVGEAARGTGELKDTLVALGIDVNTADGRVRSTSDVLAEFADKVAAVESESVQLSLAFKAFDSEGARLLPVLQQGGAGLRAMYEESERLGVVTSENARKAADLQAKLDELAWSMKNNVRNAVLDNAEAIEQLLRFMSDAIPHLGRFGNQLAMALGYRPNPQAEDAIRERMAVLKRDIDFVKGATEPVNALGVPGAAANRELFELFGGWERHLQNMKEFEALQKRLQGGRFVLANPYETAPALPRFSRPSAAKAGLPPAGAGDPRSLEADFIGGEGSDGAHGMGEFIGGLDAVVLAAGRAREQMRGLTVSVEQYGLTVQQAGAGALMRLEDHLVSVISGTESVKDAFRSMVTYIIQEMARLAVQRAIIGPLAGLLGIPLPTQSVAMRAGGGRLNAGQMAVVGESGPELWRPDAAGSIISGSELRRAGAAGGGGAMSVAIDARTIIQGDASEKTVGLIEASNRRLMKQLPGIIDTRVKDGQRRGRFET